MVEQLKKIYVYKKAHQVQAFGNEQKKSTKRVDEKKKKSK